MHTFCCRGARRAKKNRPLNKRTALQCRYGISSEGQFITVIAALVISK